ncbi:Leucine-rich repeat-containing protein 37A2 [Heterocephalus glaber]|uniref:Leucine-rich repeat-containing protein 37A2 n=1 Tax=Heterocephalus glaber TaxID=10181 RepID=G5BFN7_HETGA|nr:Leucine-rich repeat-containing protein 37A2 [Heterocephalus glaber]
MPETPSQPPEPPKVVPTLVAHEAKVVTLDLEPAQHPTSPTVTDQLLNLELTTAVLTIETQVSVPLQEAASPSPEQPEVMITHPEQVQAQHPNLAEVTLQPLDVEFVVIEYSCLEEAPVGEAEESLMKVLQAWKKNTKTKLVIQSGKSPSK